MHTQKPRIMFVDDEPNLLEGLRRSLSSKCDDWSMEFFKSAEAAIEAHRQLPFEVVVTDMKMSGMSGLQLLKTINEISPAVQCIVLTGTADLQTATNLFNTTRVFRFYTKPCSREILIDGIEAALVFDAYPLEKSVLDQFSRGILVVDAKARPSFINQTATQIISRRESLFLDRSRVLRASTRKHTDMLHDTLHQAMGQGDHAPEVSAIVLERSVLEPPLMVIAVPTSDEADPTHRYAILFVSSLVGGNYPSAQLISKMFGLTHTEGRLVEKLVVGKRLETVAEELGVTFSSARTYLKRVQKKTGTNRQVDLVRMVLEVPMP